MCWLGQMCLNGHFQNIMHYHGVCSFATLAGLLVISVALMLLVDKIDGVSDILCT